MNKPGPEPISPHRPWLRHYRDGHPSEIEVAPLVLLDLFKSALARRPDAPAILYFDRAITYAELDRMSDALAAALGDHGFATGDRLALYMQNMPQFLIGVLAAWKAGGLAVPINPMNRQRELALMLADARPRAMVCLDSLYDEVVRTLEPDVPLPDWIVTVSALDLQGRNDARVLPVGTRIDSPEDRLGEVIAGYDGRSQPARLLLPDDPAFLVYTSGTTGVPKAAVLSHLNVAFNAGCIAAWYDFDDGVGPILGVAPLFHVTGLVGHIALSWVLAVPLVLQYRFNAETMLEAIAEYRPGFTVGAITAFIAMMSRPEATPEVFSSFRRIVSGGAPIPPSVIDEFRRRTGHYIHNGYGLTETSAGIICVPSGSEAPTDPESGTLSIGVPAFGIHAWIAAEDGSALPPGEVGEIVVSGPPVAAGYWNKPDETANAMRPDGFRTGDVGFMDETCWFYLVDRKKDMINASGYKVWPREVEDVLYGHPAIREVAVVGVSHPYRGETVRAVVSLKSETTLSGEDLAAWCRPRMAAYKQPHEILIVDDLPKTAAGKILRRNLR